jgi:hypothetical protein
MELTVKHEIVSFDGHFVYEGPLNLAVQFMTR